MRNKLLIVGFILIPLVTAAGNAQSPISISPVSKQSFIVLAELENDNGGISFVS